MLLLEPLHECKLAAQRDMSRRRRRHLVLFLHWHGCIEAVVHLEAGLQLHHCGVAAEARCGQLLHLPPYFCGIFLGCGRRLDRCPRSSTLLLLLRPAAAKSQIS